MPSIPWRFPGFPGLPGGAWVARTICAALLAVPLALLALAPLAGSAAAHPASAAHAAAPALGKTVSPAVDLTLHYRSTLSGLSQPERMATDTAGNLYVSDIQLNKVLMYNSDDTVVRTYGTGTAGTGNGNLNGPEGTAVSDTTVFVVDSGNHQIQAFNKSTGAFISQFGSSYLVAPDGLALANNGTLYVTDNNRAHVVEFDTSGNFLGTFGTGGMGAGQFGLLNGIAASPLGILYIGDSGNNRVEAFTLNGTYLTEWGQSAVLIPYGIAVDRANMVYVADNRTNTIYKFDPGGSLVGAYAGMAPTPFVPGTFEFARDVAVRSGVNMPLAVYVSDPTTGLVQRFDQVLDPQLHTYQSQFGAPGTGQSQFTGPAGVVVDTSGNVYVSDSGNNRIQKFDQFGNFLLAFGALGSGNGQMHNPSSIALSPNGSILYIADDYNQRIEEFTTGGAYLGQFGTGGNGNGQFFDPQGVTTDGTDIYVADTLNDRIQVFDTTGKYLYQFGSSGTTPAKFSDPTDIAVDIARQELFVADYGNKRVQVFTASGQFIESLTSAGSGTLAGPVGVSTDQRGDVYIADSSDQIVEYDVNTTRVTSFGMAGHGTGQFTDPFAVAVSPANGQLYIADALNDRIQCWGSPWPKHDTVGIYRPSTKTFYLRNSNSTGPADIVVPMPYAQSGDIPVVGDWNGDGVDTVGLYRPSMARFLLQDANVQEAKPDYTFTLGVSGDTPIAGDWNGQGADGAGIFRPSNGILYLKNSLSTGVADYSLVLGVPGDKGVAGDWNGDGQDSPGVYRPSNQTFYVTNKVTNGVVFSDATATLGLSGDVPFTGDWIAQGFSGIGVFRPSNGVTYEKNTIVTGPADNNFVYGVAGDVPVAGQWVSPSVQFTAPAPHTLLGTHGTAPQPTTNGWHGWPVGTAPSHAPAPPPSNGQPSAATTPRRATPR